jgi:hypothetical protein
MLHMCVYMHSRFVENHPVQILEDGPLISEGVLSHYTWVQGTNLCRVYNYYNSQAHVQEQSGILPRLEW